MEKFIKNDKGYATVEAALIYPFVIIVIAAFLCFGVYNIIKINALHKAQTEASILAQDLSSKSLTGFFPVKQTVTKNAVIPMPGFLNAFTDREANKKSYTAISKAANPSLFIRNIDLLHEYSEKILKNIDFKNLIFGAMEGK